VNLVTVCEAEPDLAIFLIECTQIVSGGQGDDMHKFYANQILKRLWLMRQAVTFSQMATDLANAKPADNIDGIKARMQRVLEEAVQTNFKSEAASKHVRDISETYLDELKERCTQKLMGNSRGISSGIKTLDEIIHGFMPGSLYILAARPSLGKTTLALNFANAAVEASKRVFVFTNEMPDIQIFEKFLSLRSGVLNHKLFSGAIEDKDFERIGEALPVIVDKEFYIDDVSGRKLETLISSIRNLHMRSKLDLVIFDYIQQISIGTKANAARHRAQELGEISGSIKKIALDLRIPIVCLAQVNRDAEGRDEPPTLANIKDSGSIEQDADAVIFIHRDRQKSETECILSVAKNRFGPVKDIICNVNLKINKFY